MWTNLKFKDIKNTIFEKIDDEKVEFDKEKIEKEFQKKETAAPVKVIAKPKIEKISLIKPERSKLFDILLIKMKCSVGNFLF